MMNHHKPPTTREEAVKVLNMMDGHNFIKPEWAKAIGKQFGIEVQVTEHEDEGGKFKGLRVFEPGARRNGKLVAVGIGAMELSSLIVDKLGLKVSSFYGRGSQFDANVEAITKATSA